MTIHRFFVDPSVIRNNQVVFPFDVAQQITHVLRLKQGEKVIVCDGEAKEYIVKLDNINPYFVSGTILAEQKNIAEPIVFITLYQALVPRGKFETILQKGTEVGISSFVPIETKRSLVKKRDVKQEKIDRWQKICKEAAEQSERGIVPIVGQTLGFEEAIIQSSKKGKVLLAWEKEKEKFLSSVLGSIPPNTNISLFVGPEGGFEDQEIAFAKDHGIYSVSLGPRVLRTETAGPFFASLILYACGDFDR